MEFDAPMERIPGDPDYNAWLAAGKPEMDLLRRHLDQAVSDAATKAMTLLDEALRRVVETETGKVVVVNEDQLVDPFWLAGRKLLRSPHVPKGTAYEFDPAILESFGGSDILPA